MQQNVTILSAFLTDLGELSALEARESIPVFGKTSCSVLADEIELAFVQRARDAGVELSTDVHPSLPCVTADARMLQRALMNLIENALRHTSPGGHVTLRGVPHENGVRISVEDSGVGISSHDLPKIFHRHYQGRDPTTQTGSAGLGLAIVHRIIEHHGSSVKVSSEVGTGTIFWFDLRAWNQETSAHS